MQEYLTFDEVPFLRPLEGLFAPQNRFTDVSNFYETEESEQAAVLVSHRSQPKPRKW